jgi:hypothetical protein
MKTVELPLLFYKSGDDMAHHLDNTPSVVDALEAFAGQMDSAAECLRSIKDTVAGHPVTIDADCHFIAIEGPDEVLDKLVAAGLAEEPEDADE